MPQGAFGAKVKIKVTETLTAIAHLQDIDGVTLRKTLVEATGHDAEDGYAEYYDSGKRSISPIKLLLAWDPSLPTHAALVTGYAAKSPVDFSVEDPDATEPLQFKAFIQELSRQYKQSGVFMCQCTIQPTGKPTTGVSGG
jgi:hypothetical protein